jgi:hypothetical protein
LENLSRLGTPIRSATVEDLSAIKDGSTANSEAIEKGSIPKEIWRMIDFLAEHALETQNLFSTRGPQELKDIIRNCLDTVRLFPLSVCL